jgi:hypothetical protein
MDQSNPDRGRIIDGIVAPYYARTPPHDERYLDVYVSSNGAAVQIWQGYPQSLLTNYTPRLQQDVLAIQPGIVTPYAIEMALSPTGLDGQGRPINSSVAAAAAWAWPSPQLQWLQGATARILPSPQGRTTMPLYEAVMLLQLDYRLLAVPQLRDTICAKLAVTPCIAPELIAIRSIIGTNEPQILALALRKTIEFTVNGQYSQSHLEEIQQLRASVSLLDSCWIQNCAVSSRRCRSGIRKHIKRHPFSTRIPPSLAIKTQRTTDSSLSNSLIAFAMLHKASGR